MNKLEVFSGILSNNASLNPGTSLSLYDKNRWEKIIMEVTHTHMCHLRQFGLNLCGAGAQPCDATTFTWFWNQLLSIIPSGSDKGRTINDNKWVYSYMINIALKI